MKLLPDWRTLLAAVLLTFSFPPFQWPLVWVALVPWLLALARAPSLGAAVAQGVWLSVFYICGLEFWVALALHDYGGLPWWAAGLELFVYALVAELQFVAFAALFHVVARRSSTRRPLIALVLALAYVGHDWLFPKLYVESLGHVLSNLAWLRQLTDLGGVALLTFLVVLTNLALYEWWIWRRAPREVPRPRGLTAVTSALLALALVYGGWRTGQVRAAIAEPRGTVQAALLQGGIDNDLRMAAEFQEPGALTKILKQYLALSERALALTPKPDFLVWPESAYPSRYGHPTTEEQKRCDEELRAFVANKGVPLLFGAPDVEDKGAKTLQFNALYALTPDGATRIHRKSKLVPFGEYVPGAEFVSGLQEILPIANLGAGAGPEVIELPTARGVIRIAPVICYEVLFSGFFTTPATRGADLIVNLTNESWFGATNEPYIHLALSTFRSLETRLPQLRATNTGVSALILPDGEITHATTLDREEIVNVTVPLLGARETPIEKTGQWFGPFALAVSLVALILLQRRAS